MCITDDQAKNATFKFEVELSAAYNQEQVYYYELDANRKVDGYEVKSIEIVYTDDGVSQSVPVANAGKSPTFVVTCWCGPGVCAEGRYSFKESVGWERSDHAED